MFSPNKLLSSAYSCG